MDAQVTVITPTTGHNNLSRLMGSLEEQTVPYHHLLLWDDKREGCYDNPNADPLGWNIADNITSLVLKGSIVQGDACGSALRAIGLMAANTPYVMFADTDVWYEKNHIENLLNLVDGSIWAFCRRKIWANEDDYIGIDNFESVGNCDERKVPYLLVDNNTMIVARKFGASAAVLYRETEQYNDDRLMTEFLYKHAGNPAVTTQATVNQICPSRLEPFFRENCT